MSDLKPPSHRNTGPPNLDISRLMAVDGDPRCRDGLPSFRIAASRSLSLTCGPSSRSIQGFATAPPGTLEMPPAPARRRRPLEHTSPPASQQPLGSAPPNKEEGHRINNRIEAREVRLIDAEGENRGVVPTRQALMMAEEAGLDLVEVSPDAKPPVCQDPRLRQVQISRTEEGQRGPQEAEGHRDQGDQDAPDDRRSRL